MVIAITTGDPIQPLSFDLETLLSTLKDKLTSSLNEVITETMRKQFEKEISTLMQKVESLTAKVKKGLPPMFLRKSSLHAYYMFQSEF